ncbi:DUF4352 domain-containing protein [Kytococcus sedentarius]|uniref:DUF4352 domain-containing protein n=1 Tax=Kytococcus sedentarius TaxID=1276 RepID=UPI0035BBA788
MFSSKSAPEPHERATAQGTAPRRRNWFRRHKFLTALLAIVALVGLAQLGGGSEETPSAEDRAPAQQEAASGDQDQAGAEDSQNDEAPVDEADAEPAPEAAGVGDKVTAGDFEYTVTKITPGVKQIGDSTFGEKPQGQFVLVALTVTNTGSEAQMFDDSQHKLVDSEGREHSADSEAAIYVEGNDSFLEDVNPGNTLKGTVVFDVPADAEPQEIKLMGPGFWDPAEAVVTVK